MDAQPRPGCARRHRYHHTSSVGLAGAIASRGAIVGAASALEAALIQGVSRFRDPGRGQGLAGIKRYLSRWDGKISIRSGTARLSIVPKWDDDVPLAENLPFFPGSQVQVVIPAQEGGAR